LTISQAALTITAADATRTYGAANPAFTGTVGATQNGDVITATYSTAATAVSAVGTYAIVPTPAGAALSNYNVVLVNGTLTVTSAPLTVTANNASRLYGAANPPLTGNISGLLNGDNITASFNSPVLPASSVGTYAIIPALSDPNNRLGNYSVTSANGALTVSPAPLAVTADNATRPFGAPNPVFTGSLVGVLNHDNISATFASSATVASPPGNYLILPVLADPDNRLGNYTVTSGNGVLTITQAATTLQLTSSHNPARHRHPVKFTAVVSSMGGVPTGTVSFLDGTKLLSAQPVDGAGIAIFSTSSLSVGTHLITATYSGDGNFQGSSATLSQVIRHHHERETEQAEDGEEEETR
jgi:hypothetical protein